MKEYGEVEDSKYFDLEAAKASVEAVEPEGYEPWWYNSMLIKKMWDKSISMETKYLLHTNWRLVFFHKTAEIAL